MECVELKRAEKTEISKRYVFSFSEIAERYWDTLFRIALNYYGNSSDAEDTVQDVMLKLYRSNKTFDSDEHIRNWLIRVTINACKTNLSHFWRKNRVSLDDLSEIAENTSFESTEQSDIFMAVMSLHEQHRTVLYLYYYEDFTTKEIAEMLSTTENHIRTRLSRARNKLKGVLADGQGN
ncbi:MAG: sigma-70 family RNA polymerase sigma factor [Oscillospiraceae bacterium]|nr:sigma-70 family RNA polymerase sigma factor [Oscillospiraceae bacterium]